jgi:quercetin dioxygenase-like cupin family protein
MPESIIISAANEKVLKPTTTFTGEVHLDMLHMDKSAALANVTFTPCARTYWHTHEGGQMIRVLNGTGWICDKGGDTIWAPPGTTHWHGADDSSVMTHFVVGIGATNWHEAVTDEEYKNRATQ